MNGENQSTDENRKRKAIGEGIARTYIVCPLCGLNRVLVKWEKGRIRFGNFDLKNSFFIQTRYVRGGRGSGFWLNENESRRISEITDDNEFRDLLVQIKNQCQAILNYFDRLGI